MTGPFSFAFSVPNVYSRFKRSHSHFPRLAKPHAGYTPGQRETGSGPAHFSEAASFHATPARIVLATGRPNGIHTPAHQKMMAPSPSGTAL